MSVSKPFPPDNGMLSFWRTQPHELDSSRSTEVLPSECDVVIIGAGYAGAASAYHLLDGNPFPPSIVILEARQACSGATGRNGGHIKPDIYSGASTYAARHGIEAAAEMAKFEADHVFAIKSLVEKEKIDCDFNITRAIDVQLSEEHALKLKELQENLVQSGVAAALEVQYTPKERAERISGVKGAQGCFSFTAGSIWPYKLVMSLLSIAVSKGANLQTHTPVASVTTTPDPQTGYHTVTTKSRGSIRAKKVIYATNSYTSALLPEYSGRIVPVRGVCSRIATPKDKPAPHLPNTYSLRWNGSQYDYLISRPDDGSIIVGGARPAYLSDSSSWYNVVDDTQLINDGTRAYFDNYMQRHFRGWEDSGAYTDRVWTGIMGYSADSLPHVGEVLGRPGQYILAGFTGHGMPMIFLAAKGIAKMVKGEQGEVAFTETGIPRLFRTSRERLESEQNDILGKTGSGGEKALL